jgi:glycosyltransferase involved in cell wall biosynthesis
LRVLHITAAYKPAFIYGGPTMSVAMLCEELAKAGVEVKVFTTTANGKKELLVKPNKQLMVDGVAVTYFKRITKDHTHFSPTLLQELNKHIKHFDIIHIHAWWNLVSIFSCLIAIAKGVPVIISPRGMLSNYSFANRNTGAKGLIHQLLGKRLLQKSHLHVTSDNEKEAVNRLFKPLSIANIPNFVKLGNIEDIDFVPPSPELKLLFFSRIEAKKGLDILIKALPHVFVPYSLTIAGHGEIEYINSLKELAVKNGVADNINWVGFYGDNKFELLQQHHLLVLPSHDENFGNVVIESLGVGTAVLLSRQVGLSTYVRENQLGWVCENTPELLANKINEIGGAASADLARIYQIAPSLVRRDFTGNTLTQKYIQYYRDILSAPTGK